MHLNLEWNSVVRVLLNEGPLVQTRENLMLLASLWDFKYTNQGLRIDATLRFLQSKGKGRVLSRPLIVIANSIKLR